jgi:hypothetical protein
MVSAALFIGGNLSMTSNRAVRDFSHRTVKISHRTVNPPSKSKQVVIGCIPENRRFLFMFCIDIIKFSVRCEIFTVR